MDRQPPNFERPERPRRPPPREERPRAKGRRYNAALIFGIAAFAVAAVYAALVVVTWADNYFLPGNEIHLGFNLPGVDNGENPAVADINQRINILVLGLDRRPDTPKETPSRTDTVFIATVDPFSKTAGILNIPRDLLVEIPDGAGGFFQDRINTAYVYGETNGYPGGGPQLAIDTVEHNFQIHDIQIPIDYYLVIDFNAFIGFIDEIGGVDIDVPKYVADFNFPECESSCPPAAFEFFPGPQHMDGRTALAYARIRAGSDDLERIERQQLVIRAVAEKAFSRNLLLPNEALSLYKHFKDAVLTNISDFRILGLAKLGQQVGSQRLKMVSLREAVYPCQDCEAAYLLADWDKVEELEARVFVDGPLQAEGAMIEVQNGTGQPGLAASFARALLSRGLLPEAIKTSDGEYQDYTRIISLNGKVYTAQKLAEWLGLSQDRIIMADDAEAAPYMGRGVDIVVILGADAGVPGGG